MKIAIYLLTMLPIGVTCILKGIDLNPFLVLLFGTGYYLFLSQVIKD